MRSVSFLSAIISTSPVHATYRTSSIMSSSRSSARPLRRTFLVSMVIWMHSLGVLYNLRRHHCVRVLLRVLFVIFLCHCDICSHTDNVIEGFVNGVCLHFSFLGVSTQKWFTLDPFTETSSYPQLLRSTPSPARSPFQNQYYVRLKTMTFLSLAVLF